MDYLRSKLQMGTLLRSPLPYRGDTFGDFLFHTELDTFGDPKKIFPLSITAFDTSAQTLGSWAFAADALKSGDLGFLILSSLSDIASIQVSSVVTIDNNVLSG